MAAVAFSIKRRREIDAFLAADLVDWSATGEQQAGLESSAGGVPALGKKRVVGRSSGVPARVVAIGTDYQTEDIASFRQKEALFDDVTRSFLIALHEVLDDQYRAYVNVPVKDIVKEATPGKVPAPALAELVSVVICKKSNLSLICGILLHDKSPRARHRSWLLETVFAQIGRPLLSFPLETDYSPAEIDEQLDKVMHRSFLNRD